MARRQRRTGRPFNLLHPIRVRVTMLTNLKPLLMTMPTTNRLLRALAAGLYAASMLLSPTAWAQLSPFTSTAANPSHAGLALFSAAPAGLPQPPWRTVGIPGDKIPLTSFRVTPVDGQHVLRVEAAKAYGNLVHALPDSPVPQPGLQLRWRWRLDQGLQDADLRRREGDDVALKVCALFDQPLERVHLVDRALLRLARAASAESLPTATLCYVWDTGLIPGTLLPNAYTSRVRLIVVDSGPPRPGQWNLHARDLTTDFRRAFGEEGATVPPLIGVLIGADADNTGGHSLGFVGDVTLAP